MLELSSICKYSEILTKIDEYPVYKIGAEWLTNFIAKPHSNLGRPGAVCPFVPAALKKDLVTFAVIRTEEHNKEEAFAKLSPVVNFFLHIEPTSGSMRAIKCLVIFFPDMDPTQAEDFIDGGHTILKKYYVKHGLMIGEFHALSQVAGYYNTDFYPMISPVPAFAIRYMSTHDIQFFNMANDSAKTREYYLHYYLKFVGGKLSAKQLEQTKRMLSELQVCTQKSLNSQSQAGQLA